MLNAPRDYSINWHKMKKLIKHIKSQPIGKYTIEIHDRKEKWSKFSKYGWFLRKVFRKFFERNLY